MTPAPLNERCTCCQRAAATIADRDLGLVRVACFEAAIKQLIQITPPTAPAPEAPQP